MIELDTMPLNSRTLAKLLQDYERLRVAEERMTCDVAEPTTTTYPTPNLRSTDLLAAVLRDTAEQDVLYRRGRGREVAA